MLGPLLLGTAGMVAASLPVTPSAPRALPQAARPEQAAEATSGTFLPAPSSRTSPYAGLFDPRQVIEHAQPRERQTDGIAVQGQPTVVCDMTIFEANPAFDARIRVPATNPDVRYAIRRMPAPACR